MKKDGTGIYALAVCFICAVVFTFASGTAIYSLVRIAAPSFTLSSAEYQALQSNRLFVKRWPQDKTADEATLTELRLQHYDRAVSSEMRSGWQSLLKYLITILVATLLFWVHWRLANPRSPPPPPPGRG